MRVLGIDCGSEYTGYGVVEETSDRKLVCHVNGAIKLKSGTAMAAKLEKIFTDLKAIIAKHQPEIMAIEDVFYAVNVKSALKLGQVRGVAMLAASTSGLQVAEYSPLSIKSAVVGYGRADKIPGAADGYAAFESGRSAAAHGRIGRAGHCHLPHSYSGHQ